MAEQNRAAGYCPQCQRGVTIVRPVGKGLLGKIQKALTNNEDSWVCSKCGEPASKGFAPQKDPARPSVSAPPADPRQNSTTSLSGAPLQENLAPDDTARQPMFTVAAPKPQTPEPEATCHLCGQSLPMASDPSDTPVACPGCKAMVLLPQPDSETKFTTTPAVFKLNDDPSRPGISKSVCTLCRFEMTYPKKLSGKAVTCPSCSTPFQLP